MTSTDSGTRDADLRLDPCLYARYDIGAPLQEAFRISFWHPHEDLRLGTTACSIYQTSSHHVSDDLTVADVDVGLRNVDDTQRLTLICPSGAFLSSMMASFP